MHDLNDLYYFVQVVRNGGFAPAGRALGIPKSRLSRRIALLEERLGVRLIQRSTRSFAVTELGQEYYEQCLSMLAGAEAAQEVIDRTHAEPQGTIRLSAPPALIHYFLGELIARFMVKCPKVQVYLKSFSRPVDVLREGYDLAVRVRFGPIESSDLVMKPLGISGQRLVAAPALARAVAQPADPSALGQLPTLALGIDGRESHWKLDGPDGARLSVPFSPPGDRRHDGVETGRRAGRGRGGAAPADDPRGTGGRPADRRGPALGARAGQRACRVSVTPGSLARRARAAGFHGRRIPEAGPARTRGMPGAGRTPLARQWACLPVADCRVRPDPGLGPDSVLRIGRCGRFSTATAAADRILG